MIRITKEQIISCIKNFIDLRYRVDIVRTYCLEQGKDELNTEIFLQVYRDNHSKLQALYLAGKLNYTPNDLFVDLANYVIQKKSRELGITYVYNKGRLIHIY